MGSVLKTDMWGRNGTQRYLEVPFGIKHSYLVVREEKKLHLETAKEAWK